MGTQILADAYPHSDGLQKTPEIITESHSVENDNDDSKPTAKASSGAIPGITINLVKSASPSPHPKSQPAKETSDDSLPLDEQEQAAFKEAVKREIAAARSGTTRAPKFGHIKFSSAETEANTNANSYFGGSAMGTPVMDAYGGSDVSDIEGELSPARVPRRRKQQARSRSRGLSFGGHTNAHAGMPGHTVDPESPCAAFEHRVAFDTFDNKNATDFSLTLQSKHEDYKYSRISRTFLCGTDKNKYSENAVSWLMDDLAEDGDEIVCLRVIDPSSKLSSNDKALYEKRYRDEAHKFLEHIMTKNKKGKKISLILEFAVGSVESLIKRMIQIYEPSVLIVGTKGRSMEGFKGLLPGSVSKWCLQHSPIPVVVVKPLSKRENSKLKREANPNKESYMDMIAAHPDDTPKIYQQLSSSGKLPPQIPAFLRRDFLGVSSASLPAMSSEPILQLDSSQSKEQQQPQSQQQQQSLTAPESERLGRFDRLRSRSRSPLPFSKLK